MKAPFSHIVRVAFLCISFFVLLYSCKKDIEDYTSPSIEFIIDDGFISSDTSAKVGDTLYIKVLAESLSEYALTTIRFERITPLDTIVIDTGMHVQSILMNKKIIKSVADWEIWNITTRDRNRKESTTISLKITKEESSTHGDITHILPISLGFQGNSEFESFYSLSDQTIYNIEDAFSIQEEIHLLSYFDNVDEDEHTIASPGANVPLGIFQDQFALENWDTRNTTRFAEPNITIEDFDSCENDSLIYATTFAFETGKRKAKNLKTNDIYSFVSDKGNFGLIKVNALSGNEAGNVVIEIKMK